jgi:hypothetical protein
MIFNNLYSNSIGVTNFGCLDLPLLEEAGNLGVFDNKSCAKLYTVPWGTREFTLVEILPLCWLKGDFQH